MLDKWNDSFAKSQLEKYGWKSGEGLGKEKHGNAKHITVTVKNDTKGVGSNNEQWDFAWWDHLYNKSANAVSVAKDSEAGVVKIETKKKIGERRTRTGIISAHRPTGKKEPTSMAAVAEEQNLSDSVRDLQTNMSQIIARTSLYSGFVKSSTQSPSSTPQTPSDDEDDQKDYSIKITDEELFAACEGRTARKGGRGLVEQKGKYARVMTEYLKYANDEKNETPVKRDVPEGNEATSATKGKISRKEKKKKKDKKRKLSDDNKTSPPSKKHKKEKKEKKQKKKKKDKKD